MFNKIGCPPFAPDDATLSFTVVPERYERRSMVLTRNPPFIQLDGAFADDQPVTAAMLDRLLHHAHIVQISDENYRLRDKSNVG